MLIYIIVLHWDIKAVVIEEVMDGNGNRLSRT